MLNNEKKIPTQKSSSDGKAASATAGATRSTKTISPAKLAANRRNAQKATGPKTEEGKDRSRWNAVKHGLLSKRLAAIDSKSNRAFVQLLASLSEDLRPKGALEEILVEKIAMGYWRLHVAVGYEVDLSRFAEAFLESSDRLCRYSSSIHRQMKQDTEQLERVQRQRRKVTLPTLDIKFDSFDPYLPIDVLHEHQIEVSPGIIADFSTEVDTCNRSTTETLPLREEGYPVTRSSSSETSVAGDPWTTLPEWAEAKYQKLLPNEPTADHTTGLGD